MRRIFPYLILTLITIISTFIVWTGSKDKMISVYKHYDGPLYLVPAKTLYNPKAIDNLHLEMSMPNKYFAAHLPLYPFLIRIVNEVGSIFGKSNLGYLRSMIGVNILATVGLVIFFYYVITKLKLTSNPLLLSIILLFLPRFLVVRSVGAPESIFILLILLSLFSFEKQKFLLSGLFGGLAVMTKSPGILLFGGYCLVLVERLIKTKKINWHWIWLGLIPLGLLGVFGIFGVQYKDFFAYFNSGDNLHLVLPYAVFDFTKSWVGTAWLEDILFYFFIYGLAIWQLKDIKYRSFFYFGLVFFIATLFVQHRDIARYSLPLWPLTLIAYEKFFISKKFIIVSLILLPAIFLYAWNMLGYNVMPISDWKPFLN